MSIRFRKDSISGAISKLYLHAGQIMLHACKIYLALMLQVATMTAFWAAVVLGRAFELHSFPNTISFSAAYDWASINLTPQQDYEQVLKDGKPCICACQSTAPSTAQSGNTV